MPERRPQARPGGPARRLLAAAIGSLAISLPSPGLFAQSLAVGSCLGFGESAGAGSAASRIVLPPNPMQPDRHQCCRKGCHAAQERRKKGALVAPGDAHDDGPEDPAACC